MNVDEDSFTMFRYELALVEAQIRTIEIKSWFLLCCYKWCPLSPTVKIATISLQSVCH